MGLPGPVIGAIPVYVGLNACLLLVGRDKLVVVAPGRDVLREVLLSPLLLSRYARTQAVVELSRKEPGELLDMLRRRGCKIIWSVRRDMVKYVEFKRRLFGHGVVAMVVHMINGEKHEFNLVYGPGKGMSMDEAIGNAFSRLESVGIRVISKV